MKLLLSVVGLLAPTTLFGQTGAARRVLKECVIIGLILSGVWISSVFSADRPNVLLIISDDQGYGEFGFTGNELVKTPNLDQLASESAVFRNFVVAPACSPSRSAIFTGRNHLLTGVWGVPPRANLRRDETMMPAFFQAAGYNTLFVGKMDCSQPYQTLAWEVGWDDAVGGASGYDHRNPIITRKAGKETIGGWTAEIWTEEAIRFIRERKDQPWLLSVAYIIPHMPWERADERHAPDFRAQGCSDLLAANFSHIAQMDACIGQLLDALRKTGQEHRTLVVFVSDNGQTGPEVKRVSDDGHVPGEDWAKKKHEAVGFATAGDSVSYALDVVSAGRYQVTVQGEGSDTCAPLTLDIGGMIVHPHKSWKNAVHFGTVELKLGRSSLRITAGEPEQGAKPARLRWVIFTPVDRAAPEETNAMMQPRLTAGSNATVLLDRKPFCGIGVNYFDCFLRTLHDGDDTSYDAGFATLATKGIPFVRFAATGFWPSDMKLYIENCDEYFRRLDGVVRSAEKHGVGLVPSLFWYYACVPDLVGEPMDQWANPQSKTQAWMRRYVEEVVTRYKSSPAIWMWEMGNEYSLAASLPNAKQHRAATAIKLGTPATRSERDELTFAMVRQAFAAFAREVQKYDPHRLVSTGDSMLRPSAWHQEREGTWTRDNPDQYAEMLALANPDPVGAISLHAYDDAHGRFPSSRKASLRMNKPIFLGEFGVRGETPESAEKFRGMLTAITENKIPLAALWVFDYARQPNFNITATNPRDWQLEAIADANALLHQLGSASRD